MIQKIQMRTYPMNPLQQQMRNDIKKINDCEEVIVQADKTSNLYLIKPDSYSKHLADSITKEYKRNSPTTMEKIDEEAASVATNLKSTASTPASPRLIINPLYNLLENCKL